MIELIQLGVTLTHVYIFHVYNFLSNALHINSTRMDMISISIHFFFGFDSICIFELGDITKMKW